MLYHCFFSLPKCASQRMLDILRIGDHSSDMAILSTAMILSPHTLVLKVCNYKRREGGGGLYDSIAASSISGVKGDCIGESKVFLGYQKSLVLTTLVVCSTNYFTTYRPTPTFHAVLIDSLIQRHLFCTALPRKGAQVTFVVKLSYIVW